MTATLSCRTLPIGGSDVGQPAVKVRDDLHIHPGQPMLAGEQVPKQLARTRGFKIGSFQSIMDDAAVGPGLKAVLKETLGWAWKEAKTKANYANTVIGALAPTTPDDWAGLGKNGIELHPVSTPAQGVGAFFGGMWP